MGGDGRAFMRCKQCRRTVSRSVVLGGVCPACVGQLSLLESDEDEARF